MRFQHPLTTRNSSLATSSNVAYRITTGADKGLFFMQAIRIERHIGGRTLAIETGTYAKLADGSVTVQYGDSVVFGAVVRANPREGIDFFPLQRSEEHTS